MSLDIHNKNILIKICFHHSKAAEKLNPVSQKNRHMVWFSSAGHICTYIYFRCAAVFWKIQAFSLKEKIVHCLAISNTTCATRHSLSTHTCLHDATDERLTDGCKRLL